MRPVAAVAQSFARLGPLLDPSDFDFKLARGHRQVLDRAALMGIRFKRATRLGGKIIPLDPLDGLDPADDGKCRLAIIGWIKTVEWVQWYDFSAEPGGTLESDAHQRGSVENLSVTSGELEVEVAGIKERAKAGETLRYRCDRPHTIRNVAPEAAAAVMVCILKAAVME